MNWFVESDFWREEDFDTTAAWVLEPRHVVKEDRTGVSQQVYSRLQLSVQQRPNLWRLDWQHELINWATSRRLNQHIDFPPTPLLDYVAEKPQKGGHLFTNPNPPHKYDTQQTVIMQPAEATRLKSSWLKSEQKLSPSYEPWLQRESVRTQEQLAWSCSAGSDCWSLGAFTHSIAQSVFTASSRFSSGWRVLGLVPGFHGKNGECSAGRKDLI